MTETPSTPNPRSDVVGIRKHRIQYAVTHTPTTAFRFAGEKDVRCCYALPAMNGQKTALGHRFIDSIRRHRIAVGAILVLYVVTGILGVPAVHRQLRQHGARHYAYYQQLVAMGYAEPTRLSEARVSFHATFPILPAVVVSYYDTVVGPLDGECYVAFFFTAGNEPYRLFDHLVWIS